MPTDTTFKYSVGDLIRYRDKKWEIVDVVDRPDRRAYKLVQYYSGVNLVTSRVDVDKGAELIEKANQPHQ